MKFSISMNDELVKRVDRAAEAEYQTRSAYISSAVTQMLNSQEVVFALRDLVVLLRQVYDSGKLDDDGIEKLKQLEAVLQLCK